MNPRKALEKLTEMIDNFSFDGKVFADDLEDLEQIKAIFTELVEAYYGAN